MVCMKYVNGTIELCNDLQTLDSGSVGAYLNPFTEIAVDTDAEGRILTPHFWAIVRVNIIGTVAEEDKKDNPLHRGDTLGFRLNLTKCCAPGYRGPNTTVLGMFELDLGKIRKNQACFPYVNHTQLVKVPPMILPGDHGGYAVKLVVRVMKGGERLEDLRDSNDFGVQSVASLYFNRKGFRVADSGNVADGDCCIFGDGSGDTTT